MTVTIATLPGRLCWSFTMTAMQSTISSETPAAALHVRPRLPAGCAELLALGASVFVVPGFGGAQAASSVS